MTAAPVTRPLRQVARMIRSRNAGSYLVTIDIVFPTEASYRACRDANTIDPAVIAGLYQVEPASVAVIPHDPSWAIKVTLPRQAPSGSPSDTDIDSSQQYVPLLAIDVPFPPTDTVVATPSGHDIITRPSIGVSLARRVIDAATAFAATLEGRAFAIAIVDESGVLKAFQRMDGAPLIAGQLAQDKAYTAAGSGIPSHLWHDVIKDDPPLAAGATAGIDRLVIFGGGYPITIDGQVVGAIGVSGGYYRDDMQVAEAGLAALG